MKKIIAVFVAGFVLAGTLCYAGNGDMGVNGVIDMANSSKSGIRFSINSQSRGYIGSYDWAINGLTSNDFGISSGSGGVLAFGVNSGNEKMRIDNVGNVGIGTNAITDPGVFGRTLDIRGTGTGGAATYYRNSTDNPEAKYFVVGYSPTAAYVLQANNAPIWFYTNGSKRMSLEASGDLRVFGGVITNDVSLTSDERYKKNITPVQNALSTLLKMDGVSYEWKKPEEYMEAKAYSALLEWQKAGDMPKSPADGVAPMAKRPETKNFPEGRHYGVLAQAIEKVLPEVVRTDDNGDKAVAYSGIIPVLIEAVKEQQAMITNQQKMIEQLQKQQDELRQLLIK